MWPRSATSGALLIRASSWAISGWLRPSIPVTRPGSLIKAGDSCAQRLLSEAGWSYRLKARMGQGRGSTARVVRADRKDGLGATLGRITRSIPKHPIKNACTDDSRRRRPYEQVV